MKTKTFVCIFCFLLICACSDNMTTNPVQGNSNLEQYIDKTSTEPVMCLSEAITRFMIDHSEWYDSSIFNDNHPISFEDLIWNQEPEITELKGYFESNFSNFLINEDNTFSFKGLKYKFQVEKYLRKLPGINKNIELQNYGVMFDTDYSNDIGEGDIFFRSRSGKIEKNHVILTEENINGNLMILTLKEITPEPILKPQSDPGTYLVLTSLKISYDNEGGSSPEVEMFIMGHQSSFYYSSVTNHKFDGDDHIDAAGNLKSYPDVNSLGTSYPCNDIYILRLTDDFEQRIILIESDYGDGKMAEDHSGAYEDYYVLRTDIFSWDMNNPGGDPSENIQRWFRICYDNPDNNDDFYWKSEVRNLKKSTVPTSETTVETDHATYKFKKITVTS